MDPEHDTQALWYVRTADGETLAPLSFEELCDEVWHDKLGAGDRVSLNGIDWVLLEDIPGLSANWIVVEQDYRGPMSRSVIRQLLQAGAILPDTPLRNLRTGQETTTKDVLSSPPVGQCPQAKDPRTTPNDTSSPTPTPIAESSTLVRADDTRTRVQCPKCHSSSLRRRARSPLIKALPWSKCYACDACDCLFVTFAGCLTWQIRSRA